MKEEHRDRVIELIDTLDEFLEAIDYCDETNEEEVAVLGEIFTRATKQFIEMAPLIGHTLIKEKRILEQENDFPDIIGDD